MPYYEGKLIGSLNHRFGTFEAVPRQKRFGVKAEANTPTAEQLENPHYGVHSRYWIPERVALDLYAKKKCRHEWVFAFRDVCRAIVDARTLQACVLPRVPCNHKSPFFAFDSEPADAGLAALILSSAWATFVVDYSLRQKIAGATLTKGISYQLPIPSPNLLNQPFCKSDYGKFICPRALELGYGVWALESWATHCGYDGSPFRWDEERRFQIRCELDAAYFHLYLGSDEEWGADTPTLREMFATPRDAVDYIMDTFPIVHRKDIARTQAKNPAGEVTSEGTYITKDTILEVYDAMAEAIRTGQPYQTSLTPPPGPPTDAEGNFIPFSEWTPDLNTSHIHPPREAATTVPTPIVIDPVFPDTELEKVLCAFLLESVQKQPGLTEDQYVDHTVLVMQSARCRVFLTGDDQTHFDQSLSSVLPELVANADARPPWRSLLGSLLANQSLARAGKGIVIGDNFEIVRADLPDIYSQFLSLLAKAAERLRELQEAAAPEEATATVVQEIQDQRAAVLTGSGV